MKKVLLSLILVCGCHVNPSDIEPLDETILSDLQRCEERLDELTDKNQDCSDAFEAQAAAIRTLNIKLANKDNQIQLLTEKLAEFNDFVIVCDTRDKTKCIDESSFAHKNDRHGWSSGACEVD